ncbi:MAG: ATP-binding protein [Kofleriaceae bacterium]
MVEQDGDQLEQDLARDTMADYHELWEGDRVLHRSAALRSDDLQRLPGRHASVTLPDGSAGRQVMYDFIVLREDGTQGTHTLSLVVARPTSSIDNMLSQLQQTLVIVGVVATVACLALLFLIIRFGLSPLRRLASEIAKLDLAGRLDPARRPGELVAVVDRLNDLLLRLDAAFIRERELTAEVAHELRTPITGLRATLEVALDRDRTAERYQRALTECLAITIQTERTVEALLSLARLDAGSVRVHAEPVALDELVRDTMATHTKRATERELVIETQLAPVTRSLDREKLRMVLDNLFDNAVSYANHRGTIRIELTVDRITVANTGCTLSAAELEHVFDRFWRADVARTGSHAGIGLALASKLVQLLGGELTATTHDGGFIATLRFVPVQSQP